MPERQAWFLAFAMALLGSSLGFAAHALWWSQEPAPPPPPPAPAEAELDAAELEALCEDLRTSDRDLLATYQGEVEGLRGELEVRETELATLREEAEADRKEDEARTRRIRALEKEVRATRTALQTATEERDRLVGELRETLEALDAQALQTEDAEGRVRTWRARSTASLWRSFVAEAKVRICERGTAKRMDRCQEAVETALSPHEDRFDRCILSTQATPALGRLVDKDARKPASAVLLPEDKAFTQKGWYVEFCDESLPEAGVY